LLKSNNISLRPVEPTDVKFLVAIENNTANWKVSGTLIPFSKNTMTDYANSVHDIAMQQQFRFVIEEFSTGITVGTVDLFEYDAINRRCGVGILIMEQFTQKGFAKEALNLVIAYSKDVLNLKQIYCNIQADNKISISLFEKIGFVKTGVRKDWYLHQQEWIAELNYQLIFD